ncbi:MAG: MoaD family protein [Chloroflexi bacterium]|nr:MoaD family protein [Chloroflexota bacterium]
MVEVRVPAPLRAHTGGEKVVQGDGSTVAELLDDLDRRYPGVRTGLFESTGELRRFVNIYVNDEDIRYIGRLEAPLADGDTVSILPAVAGGC